MMTMTKMVTSSLLDEQPPTHRRSENERVIANAPTQPDDPSNQPNQPAETKPYQPADQPADASLPEMQDCHRTTWPHPPQMNTTTIKQYTDKQGVHNVMGWDVKKGEMGADKRKTRTSNQTKRAVGEGAVSDELSVSAPRAPVPASSEGARDTSLVLLPASRVACI